MMGGEEEITGLSHYLGSDEKDAIIWVMSRQNKPTR
jgi:hypothetical protein